MDDIIEFFLELFGEVILQGSDSFLQKHIPNKYLRAFVCILILVTIIASVIGIGYGLYLLIK